MSDVDLLTIVRTAAAASGEAADDLLAVYYCAAARVALERLKAEIRSLDLLVSAREGELVRRTAPKTQLGLEETGK